MQIRSQVAVATALTLIGLSGCTTLPRSGPDDRSIQAQAGIRVGEKDRRVGMDYVLLDLTSGMLGYFRESGPTSLKTGFGAGRGGAPGTVLGIGDVVQVSIFESSTGGLFVPADAGSRPGNFVTLPQQTVDRTGTISVPYAGRIRAAGRTAEQVQRQIETTLANRAIEPQVLITLVDNQSSQVSVLGDVNTPTKLPLNAAGERILDVIARAGGLSTPSVETYITLQRRGREVTVPFSELIADSSENIFVSPGDTIYVNRERRTYLAFGASGLNGRLDFEESDLTLAEALAKAGGLLDARADPAQVFLYRMMDRTTLERMKIDVSRFAGATIPVVIRANLREPATFFAIQQLPMADKDILYVSNADSTELQKFLNIVTDVTGAAALASGDVVGTKAAIRVVGD